LSCRKFLADPFSFLLQHMLFSCFWSPGGVCLVVILIYFVRLFPFLLVVFLFLLVSVGKPTLAYLTPHHRPQFFAVPPLLSANKATHFLRSSESFFSWSLRAPGPSFRHSTLQKTSIQFPLCSWPCHSPFPLPKTYSNFIVVVAIFFNTSIARI